MNDTVVSVRYMVDEVEEALAFHTTHLGFSGASAAPLQLLSSAPPAFADVVRGQLRLLLSGPTSSAGRAMADGDRPGPGGWNRSTSSSPTSRPRSSDSDRWDWCSATTS